jgi:prophage regulatory protein
MVQTMLRRRDVERATGLSRSTIYDLMARGEFPRPIKLAARAVGWPEERILEWQRSRTGERRASAGEAA